MKTIDRLSAIAKSYGIELVKIHVGDKIYSANPANWYLNRSFICGKNEILLGLYEDEELMVVSFFHELGHVVDSKNGWYNSERQAWKIGIRLAKQQGFTFSDKTYKWVTEQLLTYKPKRKKMFKFFYHQYWKKTIFN